MRVSPVNTTYTMGSSGYVLRSKHTRLFREGWGLGCLGQVVGHILEQWEQKCGYAVRETLWKSAPGVKGMCLREDIFSGAVHVILCEQVAKGKGCAYSTRAENVRSATASAENTGPGANKKCGFSRLTDAKNVGISL